VAHALQAGDQGLILIAAPMSGLEDLLRALPAHAPVMWLCKGFQAGSKRLGHEIAAAVRSIDQEKTYGALSGPSFAKEVARGLPTALVAASTHHHLAGRAVEAFHGDALRVYTVNDLIGVEVGGAVKNVLAIAAGISDGLGMGLNARASLITRGLAEMTRLGVALGARAETFMGLSGLGDLVLTATGDLSRNRQVGLQLAEGKTLDDILQHLGHVAEGVYSAVTVQQRAQERQVDMPIVDAVVSVLQGMATPQEAVQALMRRVARPEVI
jgi:glycerol-3-phosphate dehydrogenase (NAD(P)+)